MQIFSPSALQLLRKSRNITQEQLADIVGVAQQTVGKWESSVRIPRLESIIKLADYFGVSADFLLGRSDNPNFEYRLEMSEAALVEDYRAVDNEKKKMLLTLAECLRTSIAAAINGNIGIQHQTNKSIQTIGGENIQNTINDGKEDDK